ncbi:hypothetical protein IQ260_00505 [Leptolyngbya cf. ectocarpi LEGE 11479]|uniref:Uncharacterized protein n=1 Tax=Leptolyngbya cf. ectocarpi LEGE 11479 TaxID=1828722 RepID=A0A928X195_LEPEC|nr:hypothetical protein [Leptolyngbya ectocarpi]MBE9065133.1 hypothetical protein [Leptolyngbya cf. ectocarpi LEGE 11479]
MSRYSDIRRGAQLKDAQEKYIAHISTPREPNIGSRGAREPQKVVFVEPFGFDLAVDQVAQVNNNTQGYTDLSPRITAADGAQVTDALGAKTAAFVVGFRPARVVWNRAAAKTLVRKVSAVTGQAYGAYENVSRSSCAFGRAAATDDIHDAFSAIKEEILTGTTGLALNRVTLTRERRSYR